MPKPTRRERREKGLPKKKPVPELHAEDRSGAAPSRRGDDADASSPSASSPSSRGDAAYVSMSRAERKAAERGRVSPSSARSREEVEKDDAFAAIADPAAASRKRAMKIVAFGVVALSGLMLVMWLAEAKPEAKVEPRREVSAQPGEQVKVFDPEAEKKKAAEAKKAAADAPKPAASPQVPSAGTPPPASAAPASDAPAPPPPKPPAAPPTEAPPPKPPAAPPPPKPPAAPPPPKPPTAPPPPKPPAPDPYE